MAKFKMSAEYMREYRRKHPDYVERNRIKGQQAAMKLRSESVLLPDEALFILVRDALRNKGETAALAALTELRSRNRLAAKARRAAIRLLGAQ